MKKFDLEKQIAKILLTQFYNGSKQPEIAQKISYKTYKNKSLLNWIDAARGIIHLVKKNEQI